MSMVYADTGNVPAQSPLQQTVKVSGTVTDSEGAVIGANVVEKGTTNGTVTDLDGKFTLCYNEAVWQKG